MRSGHLTFRGPALPTAGSAREDRGQSLVEFALVLPLLLLLLFGIVEFALAWRSSQVITNAAREGARAAVIGTSSEADVQAVVDSRLEAGGLDPASATVRLVLCSGSGCLGDPDTVGIEYPHHFIVFGPLLRLFEGDGQFSDDITLRSTSVMRNE